MEKEYNGHKITFNSETGEFEVKINGSTKTFASLKSAQNGIDKQAVTSFKPVEVCVINTQSHGYFRTAASTYKVRKVKLVEYIEEKVHRSRDLKRFYRTEGGEKISVGGYGNTTIYPVSSFKQLTEMAAERTKLSKQQKECYDKAEKIGEQWHKMIAKGIDPKEGN